MAKQYKGVRGWIEKQLDYVLPYSKPIQPAITFDQKGLSSTPSYGGTDPLAIYRTGTTKPVPADRAMENNTGFVYAATKVIADEIAGMELQLFEINEKGIPEEKQEHELLDLLDGVNDQQTGPELKHTIASHLELCGNAYLLMEGVKSETDTPTALFTLDPSRVKILFDKTVYPWVVKGYEFRIENRKYNFEPYEVIHIKYPDPGDPYEGIGTVQAIAPWIDLHNYAVEFNRQFFVRGIKLGQLIESEATDEASIERLRESLSADHEGVDNSHKPLVVPKGTKFTDAGKSKDMDYGGLLETTRDMILAGFRVGKTLLGTAESDTNRATAETADYVFAKRTIKPKMQLICSYLNEFLVYRYGENLYLGFLDPTPEDKSFRIQEMQAAVGNMPVLSTNEARERFQGMGPVDGGDSVMMSSSFAPLGAPTQDPDHPGQDDVVKPGNESSDTGKSIRRSKRIPKPRFFKNAQKRKEVSTYFAKKISDKLAEIQSKKFTKLTHEEYAIVWQKFNERVSVIEEELKTIIIDFNTKQKETVLANLHNIVDEKGILILKISPSDIFDKDKWVKILTDLASPVLTKLAVAESEAAGLAFGKPGIDITTNPDAAAALDEGIALMSDSYNQTVLDALHEKIGEGLAQNIGYNATADLVSDIYAFQDSTSATRVARTETFRVANYATKQSWKQIGVQTIKWYTADDGDVCPFCAAEQGKIISVDDNFYDQGDSITLADGSTMSLDYSDVGAPPLHPNCRCYQRPEDVGSLE